MTGRRSPLALRLSPATLGVLFVKMRKVEWGERERQSDLSSQLSPASVKWTKMDLSPPFFYFGGAED